MEPKTKKRQVSEPVKKKKKQKIDSLTSLCGCKQVIKTVSDSGAKIDLYTCIHVLGKFELFPGDRIRHQEQGDGFVMGVGLVNKKGVNQERLFVKFDSDRGCKYIGGVPKEKMQILFRPDYIINHNENMFHRSVSDNLVKLIGSDNFSDITLICETKRFACHKNILCIVSPMFSIMFKNSEFIESKKNEIELFEDDPNILQILISFIYGKYTLLDGENVLPTYELARKYGVDFVIRLIEDKLYDMLTDETVFDGIKIFVQDNNRDCFRSCFGYLLNNYDRMKDHKQYLELRKIQHPFLDELWEELARKTTLISSEH